MHAKALLHDAWRGERQGLCGRHKGRQSRARSPQRRPRYSRATSGAALPSQARS